MKRRVWSVILIIISISIIFLGVLGGVKYILACKELFSNTYCTVTSENDVTRDARSYWLNVYVYVNGKADGDCVYNQTYYYNSSTTGSINVIPKTGYILSSMEYKRDGLSSYDSIANGSSVTMKKSSQNILKIYLSTITTYTVNYKLGDTILDTKTGTLSTIAPSIVIPYETEKTTAYDYESYCLEGGNGSVIFDAAKREVTIKHDKCITNVVVDFYFKEKQSTTPEITLNKTATQNNSLSPLGRYFDINLNAQIGQSSVMSISDIVFVLDASGSMPWLVSTPSQTISYSQLTTYQDVELNKDYNKLRNNYKYSYYVLSDNELKPITYVKRGNTYNYTLYNTDNVNSGWYIIESASSGYKSMTSVVSSNATIYVRNPEVNKTKQEILFESLKTFLTNMKNVSPQSKVGVTTFNNANVSNIINFADSATGPINGTSAASDASAYMITLEDKDINVMMSKIESQFIITGGTNSYMGFDNARKLYGGVPSTPPEGRQRHIIFFTDGEDNATGNTSAATDLKNNYQATIFSVGLFGPSVNTTNAINFLKGICSSPSESYFTQVTNNDGLNNIFDRIFKQIEQDAKEIDVKDYIDQRFEVVDQSGTVLSAGATVSGGTLLFDETLQRFYIQWNNPTLIKITNGYEFQKTVTLKAKSDFIGGNAVPTNTPESGLTVLDEDPNNNEFMAFPIPTVNVTTAYASESGNNTIFYGESLKIEDIQQLIAELITDARLNNVKANLFSSGTHSIQYYYGGNNTVDLFGDLTFTINQNSSAYNLTVKFIPSEQTSRSSTVSMTYGNRVVTVPTNSLIMESNIYEFLYGINVVKGEITITRTIDKHYTETNNPYANQSFVYRIERYDYADCLGEPTEMFYEVLSFSANDLYTKNKTAVIKGLKKGYYKIIEESNWSYKYESSLVNTMFIGQKINGNFFGQEGVGEPYKAVANFTGNKKEITSLGDVASMVIR